MASLAELFYRLSVRTADNALQQSASDTRRWTPGAALPNGKRETVTIPLSSFQALSAPAGAQAVLILPGAAIALTLRGVAGDTGIAITPNSNPLALPVFLPLGPSPSLGIYNASLTTAQTVEVVWI